MYITVNDVNIYYECFGEGKALLFIPGNGTSFKYMKRLASMLSQEYKVYLIDRRGQGKSTSKCSLSYELNVQDIYEFIQKLNIQKPSVITHSGGAIITMMFCLKYTNILDKIILCGGSPNLEGVDLKYIKRWKMYAKYHIINPKIISMALGQKDLTNCLKDIQNEILVLAGGKDIIKEEATQTIVNGIMGAKLKIYENENHSSYITNARCFKDIQEFLSGN